MACCILAPVGAEAAPPAGAAHGPAAPPAPPGILPATPPGAQPRQDANPLTIRAAIATAPYKEAARQLLLKPYADATDTAMGDPAWDGAIETMRALGHDHAAEIVLADGGETLAGCASQVLAKLDWSRLRRARFNDAAASDCGAGAFMAATVLAWDRGKLQGATPGWADFWDVAKHPGGRGLQRNARGNLEIALLADGVAAGDVYRTLRSQDGLDRAFRKLDQLKPYIIWWDQPAQPAQLLAAGKVLLTSAPASSVSAAPHKFGVQWSGSLNETKNWVILQGSGHEAAATAALIIATDPAREVAFARATGLGPSTAEASALLPAGLLEASAGAPANLKAGLSIDEGFWLESHAALEARFAAWLAK